MRTSITPAALATGPKGELYWLLLALLFSFLCLQQLHALNPGAVSMANQSGPEFYLDANAVCIQGPQASYVSYKICNTSGTTLNNLKATLDGLSAGFVLQNGQPATQSIGTLAPGGCVSVFWFIRYSCTLDAATKITVTVSDALPGSVSTSQTLRTKGILSASAGGRLAGMAMGPAAGVNEKTWLDVEYEFGNIPKGGVAYIQPAGNPDFNAGCLQLVGVEVLSSDIPKVIPVGPTGALYYKSPDDEKSGGGGHRVVVRYYFRVQCTNANTVLKPFAAASSGNPIKYSDNYGDSPVKMPPQTGACNGDPDDFAVQRIGTGSGLEDKADCWSASWGDYDNDGFPDLFVTTHDETQPNRMFHNNRNGSFSRVNSGPVAGHIASSLASTWGDYDNDGDLDLFVANNVGSPNYLYRNEGNGKFVSIQDDPVVSDLGYAHGASWADYDNDGFLDLFVGSFFETEFNLLYHNNGDGTFSKVTNNPIIAEASPTVCGVWGDYDNDGLPDLFVANAHDVNNSLYHNRGNGKFERITTGAIVNDGGNSVGASWADYDNDGDLDLFVANAGGQNNFLYRNDGQGKFSRITDGIIVNDGGQSHGSAWGDYDNDGDLDLFVANDNENNCLYRNDGNGKFAKINNDATSGGGLSFGSAWADYDRDGDLDLFVANRNNTGNFLYENLKGNCQNWLSIQLVGSHSNASGIGSKVRIKTTVNGQAHWQMREISAQSGGGTGGQNDMTAFFGLGSAKSVDSILVEWPSGYRQRLGNHMPNQYFTIKEDNASRVSGTVFYDANKNCKQDDDEMGIPEVRLVCQPGNHIVYSNSEGQYAINLAPGNYVIQEEPEGNWKAQCPNVSGSHAVTIGGIGKEIEDNDLGNAAVCTKPDLEAHLATTANRIGFKNLMIIHYKNKGAAEASDGVLTVDLAPEMVALESTMPWTSYAKNQLRWKLKELEPGAERTIYLTFEIAGTASIGQELVTSVAITCEESDCHPEDNTSKDVSHAIGPLDPNDLQVAPEGIVTAQEWLNYRIRFQNVGNAPVATVRVEDELPAGLDLSTLEMGAVSHGYQFQANGRKLIWTFPGIFLPDSVHNEKESHGFILFRVRPDAKATPGSQLLNQAAIFFDKMPGLATNTVLNTVQGELATQSVRGQGQLLVYPNPADAWTTVQLPSPRLLQTLPEIERVRVYDALGNLVLERSGSGANRLTLQTGLLAPGHYLLEASDTNQLQYRGKLTIVR